MATTILVFLELDDKKRNFISLFAAYNLFSICALVYKKLVKRGLQFVFSNQVSGARI